MAMSSAAHAFVGQHEDCEDCRVSETENCIEVELCETHHGGN